MRNSRRAVSEGKKGFFVFLTIILSILILELALRAWGSLYLRLYFSPEKPGAYPGGRSILCLGDSFTYGFGAAKGYSYPEQLSALLNSNGKGKVQFNVHRQFYVNSSSLLKNLDKDIEKYNPDLIIVMTGCNDRWSLEDCDYPALRGGILERADIWLSHLNTYKLVRTCLLNSGNQLIYPLFAARPQLPGADRNSGPTDKPVNFRSQAVRMHYSSGEDYLWAGRHDLALKEYKAAEQLEPTNPWPHFRLACVYIQAMGQYDLGERHAFLALSYGGSSMVEYVFMLMQYSAEQKYDTQAIVDKMRGIIQGRYQGEDKIKALRYLNTLRTYSKYDWSVEGIISYNLKEILNIARERRIKLIFMQYPFLDPGIRGAIGRMGRLSGVPVVDNYLIFEEEIKKDPALKEKLFLKDGHCSTTGYGLIANNLYRNIIR